MSRDGSLSFSPTPRSPFPVACFAASPPIWGGADVIRRKGVAAMASLQSALLFATGSPPKSEAGQVMPFLGRDNLSHRQPKFGSRNDGVSFVPVGQSECAGEVSLSFDFNPDGDSPVDLALGARRPSAIVGAIPAIVVDAVDGIAIRARPHVSNKGSEVALPAVAHSDAAPPVVHPLLESWVVTSAKHSLPDRVERVRVFERHGCDPSRMKCSTRRMRKAK